MGKMSSILNCRRLMLLVLLLIVSFSEVYSQDEAKVPEPILVDEFGGSVGHCEFTARIDAFLTELSQNTDNQGYILTYKSVDELPGERNSYPVERMIANHISFRNFDRSRITFVRPGYSVEKRTQLWRVPPGADGPRGSDALPAPTIPKSKTFLFANKALASDSIGFTPEMGLGDDGEPLQEFVLESVKERERAEQAELEKRLAEEEAQENADHPAHSETSDGSAEVTQSSHPGDEQETIEEPIDRRTEEEREEARFQWANVGIAELIASQKGSRGVIIFYSDDQRYDIRKLTDFVKRGRDLLAKTEGIAASRLKIVFGGYRNNPDVEFWFVPVKGKSPVPTPEERPVEPPEEAEEN